MLNFGELIRTLKIKFQKHDSPLTKNAGNGGCSYDAGSEYQRHKLEQIPSPNNISEWTCVKKSDTNSLHNEGKMQPV